MKLIFSENSWKDYLYWQRTDKKILKRINLLIRDIQRMPYDGIGKPEPLKQTWASPAIGPAESQMNTELFIKQKMKHY